MNYEDIVTMEVMQNPELVDPRGRTIIASMTDRELLEEIATSQRVTQDLVEQFVDSLKSNPMLKMLAGRFGG